jgi:hypothetical protein
MGITFRHFLPLKTHPNRKPLELAADVRVSIEESIEQVCSRCGRKGAGIPQLHLNSLHTENGADVPEGTPIFNLALKVLREQDSVLICNSCWDDDFPED